VAVERPADVTKVWGNHTLKAGVFWEHVVNKQPGSTPNNGLLALASWGGNSTGNTFADLLLGNTTYYEESQKNVLHHIGYHRIEGFLQDSWKLAPRLTVDGGVRVAWIGPADDLGEASRSGTRTAPRSPGRRSLRHGGARRRPERADERVRCLCS
jgi:outer membrane receptor protein involved in Fe transport